MNRVFKTKWSVAHQEYVVTDEKHTTKTKSTKSAVALAVAAMMFAAGTASASFVDTSFVADNPFVFQQAKKSFETAEYQKNWGLSAMKASSAYALGYHGQGVKVGMMDSGFLTTHQELSGDRWHTVKAEGNYSQGGERYPQYAYGSKPKVPVKYNKGDKVYIDFGYDFSVGDVYLIEYDDSTYIRKVFNDGYRVRLISLNEEYNPINIDIPIEKQFNIIGKVMGKEE